MFGDEKRGGQLCCWVTRKNGSLSQNSSKRVFIGTNAASACTAVGILTSQICTLTTRFLKIPIGRGGSNSEKNSAVKAEPAVSTCVVSPLEKSRTKCELRCTTGVLEGGCACVG